MNDLISRQAAIDVLADMHCKSDEDGYVWIIRSDAWARIDALPSAQPEKRTEKRTETHSCDSIDRQAAIDAMSESLKRVFPEHRQIAEKCLKALPSVTPTKIVAQINIDNAKLKEIVDEAVKRLEEELEPKRKRGKWEEKEVHEKGTLEDIEEWQSARCSVCGKYHTAPYMYYFNNYNFCPNCGAKMTEDV